ncbi:hypothetical protein DdX_17471 [Ditylenchus destructor]|uniref:Uncharacterized protein n=1 Tax=Ditylenchus destructor TaxID=166010 RepID=A0AAD4QVR7_9BILA|nr:hypothetical protein DdX_17471 [Ditylenchus destructor]
MRIAMSDSALESPQAVVDTHRANHRNDNGNYDNVKVHFDHADFIAYYGANDQQDRHFGMSSNEPDTTATLPPPSETPCDPSAGKETCPEGYICVSQGNANRCVRVEQQV